MRLDTTNLDAYARGCAILGTGGGGDTGASLLAALAAVREHGPVEVVSVDDLPDDALVLPVSGWGAPTVGIEKLGSGEEGRLLVEAAQAWFDRTIDVLMISEIGGGNGVTPVAWAARMGMALADGDGMGRAFPEGDMASMHVVGVDPAPAFFADEHGNTVTAMPRDAAWLERIARHLVMAFGGEVAGADHPMTAARARTATVRHTLALALAIGEALGADGLDGVLRVTGGVPLIGGKVVDVERRTTGGFARGEVTVEGTGTDVGRTVVIHVQNENLVATEGDDVLACTPDLITLADESTGTRYPPSACGTASACRSSASRARPSGVRRRACEWPDPSGSATRDRGGPWRVDEPADRHRRGRHEHRRRPAGRQRERARLGEDADDRGARRWDRHRARRGRDGRPVGRRDGRARDDARAERHPAATRPRSRRGAPPRVSGERFGAALRGLASKSCARRSMPAPPSSPAAWRSTAARTALIDADPSRARGGQAPRRGSHHRSVLAAIDPSQEQEAAELVREVLGEDVGISLGHEVGGMGLLERENAAIVNAALGTVARRVIDGFVRALRDLGLRATPFMTQNDGR